MNEHTSLVEHDIDNSATTESIVDGTEDKKNVSDKNLNSPPQIDEHAAGPTGDNGITFSVTDASDPKTNLSDEDKEALKKVC